MQVIHEHVDLPQRARLLRGPRAAGRGQPADERDFALRAPQITLSLHAVQGMSEPPPRWLDLASERLVVDTLWGVQKDIAWRPYPAAFPSYDDYWHRTGKKAPESPTVPLVPR